MASINFEFHLCERCQNDNCCVWGCYYKCGVWNCPNRVYKEKTSDYVECDHHEKCTNCENFLGTKFCCEKCGTARS